jgi:hypothetical protein
MEEVQKLKECVNADLVDETFSKYEDFFKGVLRCVETIESQQQEIERLKGMAKGCDECWFFKKSGENVMEFSKFRAHAVVLREALSEAIFTITSGRLCSIGSFNNTYSVQISTSAVDRWEKSLSSEAGKDYHNPADVEALKKAKEALEVLSSIFKSLGSDTP